MSVEKMDTSAVFEMFETIKNKLDKRTDKPTEINMTAIHTVTERLENVMEEVRKPAKVEHRHVVDIASNWFFFSWALLVIIVLGLFWIIANQRQTNNQFRENDLKYRYIKMQGQTNEEILYRLERQFRYSDSIKIIRKHVERYEELVKEQAEKMERARLNSEEVERLRREAETVKGK
jgi:hypothetical protein